MRIAISRNTNWGTAGLLPVLIVGSIVWGCLGNESSHELLAPARSTAPVLSSPILPFMLPSPPPPEDCTCSDGYTTTPAGSPCGCVVPIQVGLKLEVSLDSFLTLDIELAKELADGTFLHQSQVRIMRVNAVGANQEQTDVFADLVPADLPFDNTTVQLIAQRFWTKEVGINETLFGNYSVLFVTFLGLPPSSSGGRNGSPVGDSGSGITRGQSSSPTERMKRGIMAIIIISSAVVFVIFLGVIWLLGIKCYPNESSAIVEASYVPASKVSNVGSGLSTTYFSSTTPMSLSSSFAVYTGCARNFSLAELQKATRNFHAANVVGEGAFGRVYQGQLADGNRVAVKVLQQDDERGSREFLAEAELLSRLHHRNLVKLLGVCAEGSTRCLVYELIPNGSVESHLHGPDGENGPMDWDARVKIALGAARGLAYLHEDSNPRVIHRDFKASNILLEDDFTPKISDFGLAKVASEGGSEHISTRVMGTFGYVAPEYAMTGHLLVKSDVYSYGVVLLELLSGKKPVDMSRPPGQENLVTWARPLLAHAEDLEQLLDPALEYEVPFENLAKVATIASMCVQPEVSNRPFMGEVVEALKLLYNDSKATEVRTGMNGTHTRESPSDGTQTPEPYYSEPFYRPSPTSTVEAKSSSMELSFSECESLRPFSGSVVLPRRNRSLRRPGSF